MTKRLRVGTRGSPLALSQTELAVRALQRVDRSLEVEVVPIRTSGDRTRGTGPSLDFTDEIDQRLASGDVDLAVHSAKDLPAAPVPSVRVAAYLRRADPRDCLVLRVHGTLDRLHRGARLGSSSVRRRAQLLALRPDLDIVPIRGNIGTRIDRVEADGLDGVVLAAAGLQRLGWADRISEVLSTSRCLPAPGQGAIAIEVREGDRTAARVLARIDHRPTRAAVEAERAVVRSLGGDCDLPLGALAQVGAGRLRLKAALFTTDGRLRLASESSGSVARASDIGLRVGQTLGAFGGATVLRDRRVDLGR